MGWFRIPVVVLFLLTTVADIGTGVVLVQESTALTLPFEQASGSPFFRLVALDATSGIRSRKPLFQVLRTAALRSEARSGRGLFTIDARSGALMVSPHRTHSLQEYRGFVFALDIVASTSDLSAADRGRGQATVMITVANDSAACPPSAELCFHAAETFLRLPETSRVGTFVGTLKPVTYQRLCPQSRTSYGTSDIAAPIDVSGQSGDLTVSEELDFETQRSFEWNVTCTVDSEGKSGTYVTLIHLSIDDVDDNPPRPQNGTPTTIRLEADNIVAGEPIPAQLTVLDRDSTPVNNVSVGLLDPLNLFSLRDPVVFHGVKGENSLINAVVVAASPFRFQGSSYNVSVIFEDRGLVSGKDNKVVFHIEIYNRSHDYIEPEVPELLEADATVFRRAAKHSRVAQPMEVRAQAGFFFRLAFGTGDFLVGRILGVTPATGIVYVRDEVGLSHFAGDVIRFNLTWRSKRRTDRQCRVVVHILDDGDLSTGCGSEPGRPFDTCALHAEERPCASSCGRGAARGFCEWRPAPPVAAPELMSSLYATCSPHLDSCPDGACDELERKDPLLCPQDCATKVQGEAFRRPTGRGVELSAAPCTCDGKGTCTCVRARRARTAGAALSSPRPPADHVRDLEPPPPLDVHVGRTVFHSEWSVCNGGCKAMIGGVTLVMLALVSAAALVVCRQFACLDRRKAPVDQTSMVDIDLRHVDTASEDIEEGGPVDPKLEFPRDRLALLETLGEGEFGKVVKARATGIAGGQGETTVAVKMLKENASALEEQDLISELNLLKEVSHPNVIKLLGACTGKEGPLYVVVEYAEHGSLRSYLRKRREGNIVQKELLSFSWQIAKGMAYLADIKVVHRDLAARNVLLASGKRVKISDFGLSRDVYVTDSYLKTSQGRVPVKWMAIESLADHVYTTKSDVWSFGVVLWEINRLGASPYPGISPERLYHLLQGGYRMPKPESCSQELYRIMASCWRDCPHERPSFKDLAQCLEAQLHDTVEYLPLGTYHKHSSGIHASGRRKSDQQTVIQKLAFCARGKQNENRSLLSPEDYPEAV